MEIAELLSSVFELCIIPLLGILTTYIVKFINQKAQELSEKSKNEKIQMYIDMLDKTITECVIATNQTYVNSLKEQGNFTSEAQQTAFIKTYKAVKGLLTDEAHDYLKQIYSNVDKYISEKIEYEVNNYR